MLRKNIPAKKIISGFLGFLALFSFPFLTKASNGLGGLEETAKATGHIGDGGINAGGVNEIVANIIQIVLSLLGILFLLLLIYGGYLYMTAHGNEQQVEKAKKIIFQTFIGLIIVLAAYAVSWFIINSLGGQTLG